MFGLEPAIEVEYNRTVATFPQPDYRPRENCLTLSEILKAHFLIANHFYLAGAGLGGLGPRDAGLLESAVGRQHVSFGGKVKWTDSFDVCATLFFGLIMDHAFHDANKRTAFLTVLFHLQRLGRWPKVSHLEFEDLTVEVADHKLDKYDRFKALSKSGEGDPEVKYLSYYLRKNTRDVDSAFYCVTYRELNNLLHPHGFSLENPAHNHIDICRLEQRRNLWGKTWTQVTRVGQIGFPRWTAQVNQGAIKTVRKVTNLDARHGVDSAAFFHGLDPMQSLLAAYHEPLMRLAER